jgi:protein arginine N-methyltransferase 7
VEGVAQLDTTVRDAKPEIRITPRRAVMADLAAASERACSLPGRVDVIISEIFDSQLLGEGLLPTLRDAVPRLLKVGDIPR